MQLNQIATTTLLKLAAFLATTTKNCTKGAHAVGNATTKDSSDESNGASVTWKILAHSETILRQITGKTKWSRWACVLAMIERFLVLDFDAASKEGIDDIPLNAIIVVAGV